MNADQDYRRIVRELREARGLTQEELARRLGVTFSTVNCWENGKHRPIPALARKLMALASEAGVDREAPGSGTRKARRDGRRKPASRPEGAASPRSSLPPPTPDTATPEPDRSGWPPDPRERRDFLHVIRNFPADVAAWRERAVDGILADRERFPSVPGGAGRKVARALLDEGVSQLREVARILAVLHGTPRLGNQEDPVDELVYIILSRKTREDAYQETYRALKDRFRTWDELLVAPAREVSALVRPGGLPGRKTTSLIGALRRLREEFGSCTLEPARQWPDERLEEFLCSLPELSRKSAYCIMMYAFRRDVFPVDTHVGRVLSRIGPYAGLGLELEGLDHKQLQAVLADLVPPNLRYSLHVNLVEHGRKVCRAPRPECDACDLRGHCRTFRSGEVARVTADRGPTVVDLFCGAGGISEGFRRAGFRVLMALDQDPVALRTYRLNHPDVRDDRVICGDIREYPGERMRTLLARTRVDVLIGAPPCQGFSHVGFRSRTAHLGYRLSQDERNFLYVPLIEAAAVLRPRLFLMENVPGMSSARRDDLSYLEAAERLLRERTGFSTAIWKLNAAAYGVPQERIRFFLVGSAGPLPVRPVGEYQDNTARSDFDEDALPPITLDEAIFDLPVREAGGGDFVSGRRPIEPASDIRFRRYLSKFAIIDRSPLLTGHAVRYHNPRDIELYSLLRPGEDSIHALERHERGDLMRYRTDVFDDKYARLRGDRPCKTIVSHLAKDGNGYVHPREPRSLTLREAARVQSFRDSYVFCGSASDQWTQLGNAVPPLLAEAIARSFLATLGKGVLP